jgi:DNA-binding beta-propeller fold protein YncE
VATGVTADASGTTLYVADTSNNTIRRVDVATAAVTTLAGLAAVPGGSNGVGGTARFDVPSGAVADPTGTYAFVTDANNAVRRIELATGTVTTLAGKPGACEGGADGVGTAAQFCYPEKLAINGAGTVLFVADGGNSTIRRIEVATGAVTTLAGLAGEYGSDDGVGSAARFSYPIGIAVDAAGTTLYVADLENDTIRRIDVATGTVSTLAGLAGVPGSDDGTGTAARFNWPFGVATDAAGTTVFVADYNNHTIRRVDPATGVVSTIAGTAETPGVSDGTGTAALFDSPGGIVVDVAGATAYVLDSGNDTIRRVALGTGVVTTVAGIARRSGAVDGIGKVARFNFPTGIGTTPDGRTLVVADTSNHAIRIARPVGGSAGDYDSDGVTDVAVYRPSSGTWFSLDSSSENAAYRFRGWGVQASGDVPVPGDYDGDGVIDPTVYRPSTGSWFILESHANWFGWGAAGDTLMPGDYDGDGKTDAAVYRASTGVWYVRPSGGAPSWNVTFGQAGDTPIPGDFDGDGRADIVVYRPSAGSWFVLTSSSSFTSWWFRGWGIQAQGDTPVPIDYDGDGKTDPCVFRPGPGTWFILESHANYTTWAWFGWGNATDTLMAGDYDGDGRTDATIYRSSTGVWYVRPSGGAAAWNVTFGQTGDVPLSSIR